jgi:hypothetical protein
MGMDFLAEVERAKFLDWIENNKDKILPYLLLEEEEMLLELYNNPDRIEVEK